MPEQREHDAVDDQSRDDGSRVGVSPNEPSSNSRKSTVDDEQSKQIQQLNRRVLLAWIFGPGLAVIAAAFTGLQWKAANDQVAIMREQLRDAREGASQARKDADAVIAAAKSQADSTKTLATANKTMADAAQISAESSARIAEAGKRQLAVAESQAASLRSQAESVRSEAESMHGLTEANKVIAEAASRNAEISAELATAAATTVAAQQRVTELEYGAWVWFSGIEIVQDGKPTTAPVVGKWTMFQFTLANTGRTPASDVQIPLLFAEQLPAQYAELTKVGDPDSAAYPKYSGADTTYRSVAAGETIKVSVPIGILKTDFDAVSIIINRFRVRAVLRYKDVSGDERTTMCCYESAPSFATDPRRKISVTFSSCEGHNGHSVGSIAPAPLRAGEASTKQSNAKPRPNPVTPP